MGSSCYPVGLDVADDPASWVSAGFDVSADSTVSLGEISINLIGRHPDEAAAAAAPQQQGGLVGWSFCNLPDGIDAIHGIPTIAAAAPVARRTPHPNGAVSVDHIVFQSPDADTSIRELARKAGIEPIRETSTVRKGVRQVIFRPATAIIELVESKNTVGNPPRLFGLTLVTEDVDHTHRFLPESTKPPWPAVQPGRRMTVVQHAKHGVSVAMAFMSPHVKGLEGTSEDRERLFEQRARAQEAELEQRRKQQALAGPRL
jgi:hypothetical protein